MSKLSPHYQYQRFVASYGSIRQFYPFPFWFIHWIDSRFSRGWCSAPASSTRSTGSCGFFLAESRLTSLSTSLYSPPRLWLGAVTKLSTPWCLSRTPSLSSLSAGRSSSSIAPASTSSSITTKSRLLSTPNPWSSTSTIKTWIWGFRVDSAFLS